MTDKQQIQKLREENHALREHLAALVSALNRELSDERCCSSDMLRDLETGLNALKAAREILLAEKGHESSTVRQDRSDPSDHGQG